MAVRETNENIVEEALHRLGITAQQLLDAPKIAPQIRAITRTIRQGGKAPYGPGGNLNTAWPNYLAASDSSDARKVLVVYYSIPRYMRIRLPIEAFCVAAGVQSLTILEILSATVIRQGAQASAIVAAVNHPQVVAKTVEMALTDDGIADRTILHKHAGFLPTPGGARTHITVTQQATANASAQAAAVAPPPPEATIRRLADRFNLSRAELPAQSSATPAPTIDVHEAELVEAGSNEDPNDDVREE